jgi:hypothetical protein
MTLQRTTSKSPKSKLSEGLAKKVRALVGDGDKLAHLDRGWGKPVSSLEISGEVNVTNIIQTLDSADLKDLVSLRARVLEHHDGMIIDMPLDDSVDGVPEDTIE